MVELKAVDPEAQKPKRTAGGSKSATQYPYFDLNDSIAVARAVHDQGGGTCSRDQLAAFLGYKTTRSGTYLTRIYAAKLFGLVEFTGDRVSTTDRANMILSPVMPDDEGNGRIQAFMAVPLFSKVYERFKGGTLPAEVGLQNLLKTEHGIVTDRVKPALRVMLDAAEQAGFFKTTGDKSRMIMPIGGSAVPAPAKPKPDEGTDIKKPDAQPDVQQRQPAYGGGDGGPPGVHPAIVAILRELPRSGSEWPKSKKDRFIAGFRGILDIVFPDPEGSP